MTRKTIFDFCRHFQVWHPNGEQLAKMGGYTEPGLTIAGLINAQQWPFENGNGTNYDLIIYTGRIRTYQSALPSKHKLNLPLVRHDQLRSTDVQDWQLLSTKLMGLNGDPKGFCHIYSDGYIGIEPPEQFHKRNVCEFFRIFKAYRGKKILFWIHEESCWSLNAEIHGQSFCDAMLKTPPIPFGKRIRYEL